ncbi:MAG TPA: DUF692 family protein [Pyrinomonadaceae bacterium]|nr:DUF692 family protein [Pyrinomonadaceae bacterium]
MKYLDPKPGTTAVGLALGPIVPEFIEANPELIDYVEIPFEQLRHAPEVGAIQKDLPVILHCASMSVAGFVPPDESTLAAIEIETVRTGTPWIGEHLAFITADGIDAEDQGSKSPTALTYTVCPQLSEETVARVAHNLNTLRSRFAVPLILENSPQYFDVPGSTMSMTDFIGTVVTSCNAGLLLDLTHFLISMLNTKHDAMREIDRLPLEHLVEIHISGLNVQSGVVWDDHATPATEPVFGLLQRVLKRARPRAVTVEYNWSPSFPQSTLKQHIERVHEMVG